MPQAVTHFLIPVLLLEIYRHLIIKNKKSFPVHYVFIGGLAGLLPDLDIAAYYLLSFFGFTMQEIHRTFSHNLFVPAFFCILAIFFTKFKNKELGKHHLRLSNVFWVIAFGITIHLLLDATISGTIMPFYPFLTMPFGLYLIEFVPAAWRGTILPTLDAVILILWLVYLEAKHQISRFI